MDGMTKSSWEMSARSLFARQRVESLRWFPRIRLGRPIAKYFGYRPPPHDSVGRSSGKPRAHDGWHRHDGWHAHEHCSRMRPAHRAMRIAPGGEFSLEFPLRRFDRRSICGVTSCARSKRARYAQSPPEPEPAKTLLHLFSRPPHRETV